MAISDLVSQSDLFNPWYAVIALVSALIGILTFVYQNRIVFPEKAPKVVRGWPLFGSLGFWTRRMDFHNLHASQSSTGNFSYQVGLNGVVGVSGLQGKKYFFESPKLNMNKGYEGLFAGAPTAPSEAFTQDQEADAKYFSRRLVPMMKREVFVKSVHGLISDTRARMQQLIDEKVTTMNPFETIYRIVYQLTMRTVACHDIADDLDLLDKTLHWYEMVEQAGTPTVIMFPSLPTWSKLKRTYGGGRIYMAFDKIVKQRRATGQRADDPLQYLIDLGDDTLSIIKFVMGALFAGQLNSGINASWVLTYLANNKEWRDGCRREVEKVAAKYDPDNSKHLADRLASVPLEAWENDFPLAEACLRDSIRLNAQGAAFRKNTTGKDLVLGNDVIPNNFYVSYHVSDTHLNPEIYPDPFVWNPSRYFNPDGTPATGPDSFEERTKNVDYPFLGWGVARHPCLGMRFAKLEQNIIIAFFLAYFDFELAEPEKGLPTNDHNSYSAHKPADPAQIRLRAL